jgi:copper chaperone CopZ
MSAPQTRSHKTAEGIFSLFNLGCSGCSAIVERKLKKLSGIKDVTVNYVTDTVQVSYDPMKITTDDIRRFLKKLGYNTLTSHPEATTHG